MGMLKVALKPDRVVYTVREMRETNSEMRLTIDFMYFAFAGASMAQLTEEVAQLRAQLSTSAAGGGASVAVAALTSQVAQLTAQLTAERAERTRDTARIIAAIGAQASPTPLLPPALPPSPRADPVVMLPGAVPDTAHDASDTAALPAGIDAE